MKVREKPRDEAKATKQSVEPSEPLPDEPRLKPATYAPATAQQKAASTIPAVAERSPMQRYRRKWKRAVPGLDEFAHRLQIPEDVRSMISGKFQVYHTRQRPDPEHRKTGKEGSQKQAKVIRCVYFTPLKLFIRELIKLEMSPVKRPPNGKYLSSALIYHSN